MKRKLIIFFILIQFPLVLSAHINVKHVLLLNSYHRGFQWTDDQVESAIKVLRKGIEHLELYIEYLDTKRIYNDIYLNKFKQIFQQKYENKKFDLIITTDDNALTFVMNNHSTLFQHAPVSFCGINDYNENKFKKYYNTTGLIEVLDIKGTINLALTLFPKTENIYVIVDSTPTGLGQFKNINSVAQKHFSYLKFTYFTGSKYSHEELLKNLKEIPHNSVVLLAVWLRDKNEVYLPADIAGLNISKNAPVPLFGIIDMYLGHGILGGQLLNSSTHGRIAAEIGLKLLKGNKSSELPIMIESTNPFMFDYEQIKRWDVPLEKLPANRIIINRAPTVFQKYTKEIITTIALIVLLVGAIVYLSFNIKMRSRAEKALNEVNIELNEKTQFISTMINLSPDLVYIYDLNDQTNKFVNQALTTMLGFTEDELKSMGSGFLKDLLHPEDFDNYLQNIIARYNNLNDKEIFEHSYRILHKNGTWKWITAKELVFERNTDNTVKQIFGLARDTTSDKESAEKIEKSLKEKEVLLKEIHHRVKNNLQIIISLINLTKNEITKKNPIEIFDATVSRIYSISLVHEMLYKSNNFASINFHQYVETMMKELLITYDSMRSITINIDIGEIEIEIQKAIPCGIILTELLTNSLKYAFPDNEPGNICIKLHKLDDNSFQLYYHDNGIGIPEHIDINNSDSLGLKLLSVLTDQLDGELIFERKGGTTFYINFNRKEL